jgi:hypothetical protein
VDVDQNLVDASANVDWLKSNGAEVERFNLSQQPMAFVENPGVKNVLDTDGSDALPVLVLDGEIVLKGRYPSRDELADWFGLAAAAGAPAANKAACAPNSDCC